MQRILYPTDFSENSNDAIDYILAMNKDKAVDLKIIHVADPSSNIKDVPMSAIEMIKGLTVAATDKLIAIRDRVKSATDNATKPWKVNIEVLVGNPVLKIKECADDFNADLLVLGNKGENYSMSDKILGVTSLSLSDEAACPVLLVPKEYKYENLNNVVYPTDLDYSDPYILWKSMKVLSPLKPVIRCLHVKTKNDPQLSEQEAFAKYMVDNSPSIQTIFHNEEGEDPAEYLKSFVNDYDCQMVIMHKRERSFFSKLFSKSVTQNMRRNVNVPLLIMNIQS